MKLPSDDIINNYMQRNDQKQNNALAKYITPLIPLLIAIIPLFFYSQEEYLKINWNQHIAMFVGILIPIVVNDIGSVNLRQKLYSKTQQFDIICVNEIIYNKIINSVRNGTIKQQSGNWILNVSYYDEFGNLTQSQTDTTTVRYDPAMCDDRICRFTFQDKEYAYKKSKNHVLFAACHSDTLLLLEHLEKTETRQFTNVRIATFMNKKGYGSDELFYEHAIVSPQLIVDDDNEKLLTDIITRFVDPKQRIRMGKLGLKNKISLFLYGPPGTGKSSVAVYIASCLKRNIYFVDKKCTDKFFTSYSKLINYEQTVVVFDDVDFLDMKDRFKTCENGFVTMNNNLVSLMDMLDGNSIGDNAVLIFTTNHENNFDEALFRHGRITNKLNMSVMTPSMWSKLIYNVYGVKNFKADRRITLSVAVHDYIMPNIDSYEDFCDLFRSTKNTKLSQDDV